MYLPALVWCSRQFSFEAPVISRKAVSTWTNEGGKLPGVTKLRKNTSESGQAGGSIFGYLVAF